MKKHKFPLLLVLVVITAIGVAATQQLLPKAQRPVKTIPARSVPQSEAAPRSSVAQKGNSSVVAQVSRPAQ